MTYPPQELPQQKLPRIFEIMIDVDRALPNHGRGVISPEEMMATQTASCFGRLAIVGSQLVEEGLPSENLRWLISLSHGVEFTEGKPWLGHAMLVVEEPEQQLIDSLHYMWSRQLSNTSWRASDERDLPVVDHEALRSVRRAAPTPSEGESNAALPDHLRQHVLHFVFTQHEFHEGIAFYQAKHPHLNAHDPALASDYTDFYAGVSPDLADQVTSTA